MSKFDKPFDMATDKKCPSCGQWTTWNHQLTDRCTHCNELLDKRTVEDHQRFETQLKINDENSFFAPKPGDNPFMIAFRKTAWAVHFVYMSIVSFILWLLAWLAG